MEPSRKEVPPPVSGAHLSLMREADPILRRHPNLQPRRRISWMDIC